MRATSAACPSQKFRIEPPSSSGRSSTERPVAVDKALTRTDPPSNTIARNRENGVRSSLRSGSIPVDGQLISVIDSGAGGWNLDVQHGCHRRRFLFGPRERFQPRRQSGEAGKRRRRAPGWPRSNVHRRASRRLGIPRIARSAKHGDREGDSGRNIALEQSSRLLAKPMQPFQPRFLHPGRAPVSRRRR